VSDPEYNTKVKFVLTKNKSKRGQVRISFFTGKTFSEIWLLNDEWEALKTLLEPESEEATLTIKEAK